MNSSSLNRQVRNHQCGFSTSVLYLLYLHSKKPWVQVDDDFQLGQKAQFVSPSRLEPVVLNQSRIFIYLT